MFSLSPTSLWRRLGFVLTLVCHGCSVSNNLLPQGGAPAPAAPAPQATKEEAPDEGKTTPLTSARLARRLTLDLTLRLPNRADRELLVGDGTQRAQLIDGYLNDRASAHALAALHPRMWHLDSGHLPDLDAFVAAGDTTLASALTTATRQSIVLEPSLAVRYVLEQQLPWHRVFDSSAIIAPSALVTLWQGSDQGSAFAGEDQRFATAFGRSTAAGLLVDPGFLASLGGHTGIYQRTGRLFKELLCLPSPSSSAHDFAGLSALELAGDLNALAISKKECAGCHALAAGARQSYSGLATANSFQAWLQPPAALDATSGLYAGATFQGLAGLGALVGRDPRLQRCEVLRLFEELYQRGYTQADQSTLASAIDAFHRDGESVTAAARTLVAASDYATGPVGATVKGSGRRGRSGVKVLGRAQWEALFAAVLPKNSLLFTDDLDPGHDESFTSVDHVPSGVYWHAVDRLARQAAAAVVVEELADGALATNRHLLTMLPDGAATGVSTTVATAQIQELWLTLTGVPLSDKDQTYTDLQTLWNQTSRDSTAASSRQAWALLLTGVFSHPALVTY